MKQRLPLALSVTALTIAILGATPIGHAAGSALLKAVPLAKKAIFAKRAGFATKAGLANKAKLATKATTATTATNATNAANATTAETATTANNATTVNGIAASTTPTAGALFPLGADAKFPASVIPSSAAPGWTLSGNAGTTPPTQFLGTTDAQPLVVKTNNTEALRVDQTGNVGVGITGPGAKLESFNSSGIALMGTSTSKAVVGRLGTISCPGLVGNGNYAVGGCTSNAGEVGVQGVATTSFGVFGSSETGRGVGGASGTGIGVFGDSTDRGVVGTLAGAACAGPYAVGGCAASAPGVVGKSTSHAGVLAITGTGNIFVGQSPENTNKARIDAAGKGFFNGGTQNSGADYAESIAAAGHAQLEPGDVLVISTRGFSVRKSSSPTSRLLAGVYSTRPAVLAVGGHSVDDSLAGEVPVAMMGIVPTKVSAENGAIRAGDLLTTARTPGHAMKAKPAVVRGVKIYPTGAILGKALQPLKRGTGTIRVLLMLR